MQLTDVDRWVLMNQYRILAKLDPEGRTGGHERAITALENGYEAEYSTLVPWLTDRPMSERDCHEIRAILQMHRELLVSYRKLEDKAGIEESTVTFRGFDGNEERSALTYALWLTEGGEWDELKDCGDGMNSHWPTMEGYRRMLSVWRRCIERRRHSSALGGRLLSADEIREICATR